MDPEYFSIIGAVLGGGVGFFAAVFAEPLRKSIFSPRLKLEYGKSEECNAQTPIKFTQQVDLEGHEQKFQQRATYIRVKVTNQKLALAKNCRAYLINIEKENSRGIFENTIYADSIQLAWSCQADTGFKAIDIPNGVSQFLDLMSVYQISSTFKLELNVLPFRYESILKEKGKFRFTVQVSGENINPAFIKIVFNWSGSWDKYDAYTYSTSS